MLKLEASQLKSVFEELSGQLNYYITQQSFTESLAVNRIQLVSGVNGDSAQFSLYCAELFGMLLKQKEIHALTASKSTTNSGACASSLNPKVSSVSKKSSQDVQDYCFDVQGTITKEQVITEDAF